MAQKQLLKGAFELIARIVRVYRTKGLFQVCARIAHHLPGYPRRVLFVTRGAWIGLTGNIVHVSGVTLSVDGMTPLAKALIAANRYESAEKTMLDRYLKSDLPLIELGGCIGFISALASKRINPNTPQVVVEANPRLAQVLEQNCRHNNASYSVVSASIAYEQTEVEFYVHRKIYASGLKSSGEIIRVPAITLEQLAKQNRIERFALICDIEGTECDLVTHEIDFLRQAVHSIIVEVHPAIREPGAIEEMDSALQSNGFQRMDAIGNVWYYVNARLETV